MTKHFKQKGSGSAGLVKCRAQKPNGPTLLRCAFVTCLSA